MSITIGSQVIGGGGGGATLPDTPDIVLLDASVPDTIVGLDPSGVGIALSYASMRTLIAVQDGPRYLPFQLHTPTVDATQGTLILGGSAKAIDPTQHARSGLTQTWTLILLASVTTGVTATIELYDLVAAAVAATITVTSTTEGTAHTASVTLPGTARRYKLRASCTGTTSADYLTVLGADIEQNWS